LLSSLQFQVLVVVPKIEKKRFRYSQKRYYSRDYFPVLAYFFRMLPSCSRRVCKKYEFQQNFQNLFFVTADFFIVVTVSLSHKMLFCQEEEAFVGDEMLFSFARLFKKDVILLSGAEEDGASLRYFKGGKGGQSYGRGRPLLLASCRAGPGGRTIFSSLMVNEGVDIEACLTQLREQAA
jgi:hypothetical protein